MKRGLSKKCSSIKFDEVYGNKLNKNKNYDDNIEFMDLEVLVSIVVVARSKSKRLKNMAKKKLI